MRHEQMPNNGLKRFGVRRDVLGIDDRHEDAGVRDFSGISAIAPDYADDFGTDLLGVLQRGYEVGADIFFEIPAANGEDQQRVFRVQPADFQPRFEDAGPAFVVGACGQFGNIVRRRISFDACDFSKIVDCVRRVAGTAADAKDKQASAGGARFGKKSCDLFDLLN